MKAYLRLRSEQVQNNFGKTYIYKTKVETNILGFFIFLIVFLHKLIFRMAKVVKNDLGYLGIDFQYRLIGSFINEPNFFKDLESIIDQNMFTDQYLRVVVGVMKEYFAKHDTVPSFGMIAIKLKERALTEEDVQYFQETLEKIKNTTTEGIEEIQEMAEKFFKQQNWVRVANEIIKIAKDGNAERYDEIDSLTEKAASIGRKDADTSSPLENVDGDLSKEDVVIIPTGVRQLDEALGGGVEKGKLGLIIGSSGFGKTSMTTGFAAYAATQGFRVLQIVFEDTHRDIHRKYMSYISEVESKDLNKDTETTDYVRQSLKDSPMSELINNNIRTIRLESGEKTATDIKNIIKKKINEGFKPDMVIIDYFECVAHERGTSTDKEEVKEGKTMRKFENMAAEFDALFWITTQGNRDSFGAEIITQDKVGGSIKKTQIAHVILSIARNLDDMASQKANITILKNRGNMAGKTFNGCHFNNGTCRITCDDVVDLVSVLAYNENAKDIIEDKMDYYKQKIREQKAAKQANAEKNLQTTTFSKNPRHRH